MHIYAYLSKTPSVRMLMMFCWVVNDEWIWLPLADRVIRQWNHLITLKIFVLSMKYVLREIADSSFKTQFYAKASIANGQQKQTFSILFMASTFAYHRISKCDHNEFPSPSLRDRAARSRAHNNNCSITILPLSINIATRLCSYVFERQKLGTETLIENFELHDGRSRLMNLFLSFTFHEKKKHFPMFNCRADDVTLETFLFSLLSDGGS